ncbi:MAG: ribonuclease III [Ktedonobacterales bacterium]|nr:ribonuclease III [Ktedonobacterales bacterium]
MKHRETTDDTTLLGALETTLGHTFAERHLLSDALNHRSYLNECALPGIISNERLEFLGDAVVGMVSADLLYHQYPTASEGDLTQLRAALVCAATLARFARGLQLGDALRLGRSEEAGGRERVPLLASAFEAVVGALYLDGGLPDAVRFLEPLLRAELERVVAQRQRIKDDKSLLQELAQARLGVTPRYRVVSQTGPAHARTFVIEVLLGDFAAAEGTGHSKREAEQAAAHYTLAERGWLEDVEPRDA